MTDNFTHQETIVRSMNSMTTKHEYKQSNLNSSPLILPVYNTLKKYNEKIKNNKRLVYSLKMKLLLNIQILI